MKKPGIERRGTTIELRRIGIYARKGFTISKPTSI